MCAGTDELKQEYLDELKKTILKEKITDDEKIIVDMILDDINTYLFSKDNEYNTTQHIIGMKMIFRGWVVKNWININQQTSISMKRINKIIVKRSVLYYSKSWKQRNEILHCPEIYRRYMIEWYKKI